jgi:acetyl esterase
MPLDPLLEPIVTAANSAPAPPATGLPVAELRAAANKGMEQSFLALAEPPPALATVADHQVPVQGGTITVRSYTPAGTGPYPCHVYIHGGGFWMGELSQFDTACHTLATGAGTVVLSVDYRLAPEHKFPTAPEDCYAALCWAAEQGAALHIDATRMSVGGGSAGGNLAAVVALMARDRGGPPRILQVLEVPVTDLVGDYPSHVDNGQGFILTKAAMDQYRGYYLREPEDARNPYASPMHAADLHGLPPAIVMTSELVPLRDEGEAYARRLAEAGVPVVMRRWEGQIHGASAMTKLLPSARACRDQVIAALRQANAGQSPGHTR